MGKRIKRARERLVPQVTQTDLADAFSISDKAVSEWERDKSVPELAKVPRLARLLKVPVDWLLEGKGAPPPPDDLVVRIEALQTGQRATVSAIVDTLLNQQEPVA